VVDRNFFHGSKYVMSSESSTLASRDRGATIRGSAAVQSYLGSRRLWVVSDDVGTILRLNIGRV